MVLVHAKPLSAECDAVYTLAALTLNCEGMEKRLSILLLFTHKYGRPRFTVDGTTTEVYFTRSNNEHKMMEI